MSKLRNYEISLWKDVFEDGELKEQKMYVFGADALENQARALEPKLKRGVNGSNELTFKMYYQYIDNITGEKVKNPYIGDLVNEAKIKLRFKNKWYDFIIKNVSESTSGKTISYTATDLHINELSKNGFGLTLDTSLENNIGTVSELAGRIFEDTDWVVDASEIIPQTLDETLIEVTIYDDWYATKLINDNSVAPSEQPGCSIPSGSTVFLFYSCCKNKTDRLQFIYVPKNEVISKDSDRIITNKNSQYYIDNMTYIESAQSKKYGLYQPNETITTFSVSSKYRGRRFVFSAKSLYNENLDKYVTEYSDTSGKIWHGYTETEFIAPNIIQNIVTNTDFKTTTGWQGKYRSTKEEYANKNLQYGAICTAKSFPDLLEEVINGEYSEETDYFSYIDLEFKANDTEKQSVVVNSSFYDFRKKFKGFSPNQKFVLFYKQCGLEIANNKYSNTYSFKVEVGEQLLSIADGGYGFSFTNGGPFLSFDSNNAITYSTEDENKKDYNGYKYVIASIPESYNLTEEDYSHLKVQTFITLDEAITNGESKHIGFYDFQIFPYYEVENSLVPMLPIDSVTSAETKTNYFYFSPDDEINKNATSKKNMLISKCDTPRTDLSLNYLPGAEKVNTLKVSKSNYFNACQKLCEVFECWADFDIEHDEQGYIIEKTVRFKNYIGKDNYAGFRYGVNLKDISRKVDSKKVVTKLMVTDNTNKYAKNGFCTISRAGSNETGENYIYDFSYYINHKMLSVTDLANLCYNTDIGQGPDLVLVDINHPGKNQPLNCQGYYTRLSLINKQMEEVSNEILEFSKPLMQAQADVTTYEAGASAAEEKYNINVDSFRQAAGFDYKEITTNDNTITEERKAIVNKNQTLNNYLTKIIEFSTSFQEYSKKLQDAKDTLEGYQGQYDQLQITLEEYKTWKKNLNKAFFKKYYRFIQEGTWIDNDQTDDEKYYVDALSVAYNSCMPQVSYTINVVALEGIEGYEGFTFELADKTFIEDEEYFGYDENGNPYREEAVITEVTYALDEIDKDSIKLQNYKNQFQDLFQGITASVQSVNFTSGSWDNAADFTSATDAKKSSFLQNALNYADTVLTNSGEQSVVWDKTGITITDNKMPNQQMRIIAGGIFLRDEDNDGLGWKAGITPEGINAKLITSGQVNTGIIQIMRDDEPYFRWDDHGITAYDFREDKENFITNFNTKRGVRFDRFGIYGYDMSNGFAVDGEDVIDGLTWHPDNLDEVRNNSLFSLTWDGLLLKIGQGKYVGSSGEVWHNSQCLLGKTDGKLYNGWDSLWKPTTNAQEEEEYFVKVFSAGISNNEEYQEKLAIFDNGTLLAKEARIEGTIYATAGKIGDLTIGEVESLPNDVKTAQTTADNINKDLNNFKNQTNVSINGLTESVNEKLKADYNGDYSWLFSNKDGLMMWSGNKGNGKAGNDKNGNLNDPNLLFKVYKNEDGEGILYLRGNGVFTGDIYANNGIFNGIVYANGGSFSGEVKASSGYLGDETDGWKINSSSLSYGTVATENSFFLAPSGFSMSTQSFQIGDSDEETNWVMTISKKFGIDNQGKLYAKNANISGTIVATSGSFMGKIEAGEGCVGGWIINENYLASKYSHNGVPLVGICSNKDYNNYAFWAGKDDSWAGQTGLLGGGSPFSVTHEGFLTAKYGKIGGWDLTNSTLYHYGTDTVEINNTTYYTKSFGLQIGSSGTWAISIGNLNDSNWGEGAFRVNHYGKLYATGADISGHIEASGGAIGAWLIDSDNIVANTDEHSILLKPSGIEDIGVSSAIEIGLGTFEVFFTQIGDFYEQSIDYVKNNCAMRVRCGSDVFNAEGYNPGIEAYTQDGSDQFFTVGVRSQSGDYNSSIQFSNVGTLKLYAFNNMSYGKIYFNNTEYTDESISDARKKHSIETLSEQYETLFNKLRPTRYKYIDGTSNRYHTGFIAQEVVSSLEESGLSTLDFAAVVLQEPGTENEVWQLRRDEFVALNTWQIQLLKPRMTAAEQEISQLKEKISILEIELENLKKS